MQISIKPLNTTAPLFKIQLKNICFCSVVFFPLESFSHFFGSVCSQFFTVMLRMNGSQPNKQNFAFFGTWSLFK